MIQSEATVPFPGSDQAEIWVIAGQSNATGCGMFKDELAPDPAIQMFNMNNRWMPAEEPLHRIYDSDAAVIKKCFKEIHLGTDESFIENRERGKQDIHGMFITGASFGVRFGASLHEALGKPIGLVPCAYGGSPMKLWNPADRENLDESLYAYMLDRIRRVGRISGVVWSQGEAEAATRETADAYEQAMLDLIDGLRADTGNAELPFLIVQTGRFCTMGSPQPNPLWEHVRDVQRRLPNLRPNVYTISSMDLPLDDPIHVSSEGHVETARRLSEIALREVYGHSGHAGMIQLQSIEFVDPGTIAAPPCFDRPYQFRVRFRGVSGALTSAGRPTGFEIRWPESVEQPPMFYRTEFDAERPDTVVLSVGHPGAPLPNAITLIYGSGLDPYVNIVDSAGMPIPGFGPVPLPDESNRLIAFE